MPAELSKMITDLQKEGTAVIDSGKMHAPRVAAALAERFAASAGEGQPTTDYVAVQLDLVGLAESELDELVTFDERHVSELDDDRKLLRRRDLGFGQLRDKLSEVQGLWAGVFGADASEDLYGGVTELPTDPLMLYRLGLRVHGRLADPDYPVPETRLPGPAVDRAALADDLDGPLTLLGGALAGLGGERRGSEGSLFDKRQVFERCRRTIRFAAGSLAGLYGLAGLDDLAARIRPKRRAKRRSGGQDSGGQGSGGQGSDGQGSDGQETAVPNEEAVKASEDGAPAEGSAPEAAPSGANAFDAEPADAKASDADTTDAKASGPIGIVR